MSKKINILAPAKGQVLALNKVNDEVFSSGIMGEGFGLEPLEGTIYAPVSGIITMVADSKHAIGIKTEDELEVLVHMGIVLTTVLAFIMHKKIKDVDMLDALKSVE